MSTFPKKLELPLERLPVYLFCMQHHGMYSTTELLPASMITHLYTVRKRTLKAVPNSKYVNLNRNTELGSIDVHNGMMKENNFTF